MDFTQGIVFTACFYGIFKKYVRLYNTIMAGSQYL